MQTEQPEQKQNAVQRGGFDPHTVFAEILAGRAPNGAVNADSATRLKARK